MSLSTLEVRIRRMGEADLDRVREIAASLPEAPNWPASAYSAAIDPVHIPRRVALVAELDSEKRTSEAKQAAERDLPLRDDSEEHTPGAEARVEFVCLLPGINPRPTTRTSFSTAFSGAAFQDEGFGSAGGRVVGFAVAGVVAQQAELETIAVGAEVQRGGVGRLLFRALVEELRAERVTELILEVRASNRAALGFYRTQGFEESGRRQGYYADPEEDAVLMRLNLA